MRRYETDGVCQKGGGDWTALMVLLVLQFAFVFLEDTPTKLKMGREAIVKQALSDFLGQHSAADSVG